MQDKVKKLQKKAIFWRGLEPFISGALLVLLGTPIIIFSVLTRYLGLWLIALVLVIMAGLRGSMAMRRYRVYAAIEQRLRLGKPLHLKQIGIDAALPAEVRLRIRPVTGFLPPKPSTRHIARVVEYLLQRGYFETLELVGEELVVKE